MPLKNLKTGTYYTLAALFEDEKREGYYEVIMTPTTIIDGLVNYDSSVVIKKYIPNSLKEVTVLNGEVLGYGMDGMISLEKVTVHGEKVGQTAFRSCTNLHELRILGEVIEMNNTILYGCNNLKVVYVESKAVEELVQSAVQRAKLTGVLVDVL